LSQGTVYTIEIMANNKSSGTISYTYNGISRSVAVQKFDLYVNGSLVGDDLSTGALTGGSTINAATFTGVSSTSNAANIFVDDFVVYNAVPASIGTVATPTITGNATAAAFTTTYGTASANQSFSVGGSGLTANLVATAPTGFEVSADGTTYASTATFTQSGGSANGTLRVRLAANATVSGSYDSQNIVLSSTNATSVNIVTADSGNTVSKATPSLSITSASCIFFSRLTRSSCSLLLLLLSRPPILL
jgi:hypothetical protein